MNGESMQNADHALKALDEFEAIRAQAIEELEAARKDIDAKLARLTAQAIMPSVKKSRRPRTCRVCGSTEHNAQFHKEKE
jgi:1,6-anhydro-N-acetylmuramate kinase